MLLPLLLFLPFFLSFPLGESASVLAVLSVIPLRGICF